MRLFIAVLVLIFGLQSWTKADDLGEFEIEGMSIGDSLLDYMSEKEILNQIELNKDVHYYLSDKFTQVYKYEGLSKYYFVSLYIQKRDKNYKIYAITGSMNHVDDITECHDEMDSIAKEISNLFKNAKRKDSAYNHRIDETGRSKVKEVAFHLNSKDKVRIICMDFEEDLRKKNNWIDGLDITLQTKEVSDWFFNQKN